jgi:hypothetical protein
MIFKDSQIWFGPPWTCHFEETAQNPQNIIPARRFNELISHSGVQGMHPEKVHQAPLVFPSKTTDGNVQHQSPSILSQVPRSPDIIHASTLEPAATRSPPATPVSENKPTSPHERVDDISLQQTVASISIPNTRTALLDQPSSAETSGHVPKKPLTPFKSAALASVLPPSVSPPRKSTKRASLSLPSDSNSKRVKYDEMPSTPRGSL